MRVRLLLGDCMERMAQMEENSVGSVVCDPPYGIQFMNKEFDNLGDGSNQQMWHEAWLVEAYRVLEPGGRIKTFGGTRVYHRLAQAMVQAGFQDIRLEAWVYSSGFPKSLNVSRAIDKKEGAKRGTSRVPCERDPALRPGEQNTSPWTVDALRKGYLEIPDVSPVTENAKLWEGWGTALKPAWEPVLIGTKPEA